jgi:hypothetical protein
MPQIFQIAPGVSFEDKLLYKSDAPVETRLCPLDPTHAADQRWLRPLQVQGPVVPHSDFEWTVYNDVIVSAEIARNLSKAGFTGAPFFDVEFFTTTETPFGRDSVELRACGWGGMASKKSGIHIVEECTCCGRQVFSGFTDKKRLFDIDAWDGSDFFVIWPLRRFIMITEAVAEHITDAGYSGVKIVRPDELPVLPVKGFEGYSPGSLKSWQDEIAKLAPLAKRL